MSQQSFHRDTRASSGVPSLYQSRDYWLILLLLVVSLRAGDASAAEQPAIITAVLLPDFNWSSSLSSRDPLLTPAGFALPIAYRATELPDLDRYSSHDFRPRGHSVFDGTIPVGPADQTPMLRSTTVWQRLAEYRSHGRVRLLTLWEGGASTVSLQAGKKGEPSLQWTSRLMNHGGATRGVLDQLMSFSVTGAGRSLRLPSRASTTEPNFKPSNKMDLGLAGNK